MKKLFFAVAIFTQASSFAQQTTWKNDKMHSKLRFSVTHLLISDVDGLFKKCQVAITTTKPDFSDAVFELSADVSSINTERVNPLATVKYTIRQMDLGSRDAIWMINGLSNFITFW